MKDCVNCGRDGHGLNYWTCRDIDGDKFKDLGLNCWRPRGSILIWDETDE